MSLNINEKLDVIIKAMAHESMSKGERHIGNSRHLFKCKWCGRAFGGDFKHERHKKDCPVSVYLNKEK